MSAWKEVRRLAQIRHDELASDGAALSSATSLLKSAETRTGIKVKGRPQGDSLLDGSEAAYDRERGRIYFSSATPQPLAAFHIAHEFAHHWLDGAGASCQGSDLNPYVPAEPELSLVGDQDSYSPKERAEAQANVFAREFLLPRSKLRARCESRAPDADVIAAEVGLPVALVMQQLADALLLPPERDAAELPRKEAEPDESQREAIRAANEPRQVRAGPGTGKTRTLVGRVAHLIDRGDAPSSILALSYSNISAQDLSGRIHTAVGEKATSIWSGTFHAFGLELLRKHGHAIGFAAEPKLLDRTDCLMLLEELLPSLNLHHYLDLREPMLALRSILNAISRAKDEVASPEDYQRCAQAMRDAAHDDTSIEVAEKALEVAHVYAVYENELRARGFVDFGDLVVLPIKLLREHTEIRDAVRAEKKHVLVDEYQDMNRASGLLLKELCEPGRGPWVVGDVRQAIYRFRGASPLNMANFAADFPGAKTTDLSVNYRSGGTIIRLFEVFGATMAAGRLGSQTSLSAHRGENHGSVHFNVATSRESEGHGIAQQILERVQHGATFADHAVLGRSHTILSRLADQLERAGVPCLYFGNFFERPEIRDLLSLLSLASEAKGVGLFRVAQLPRYSVPIEDIRLMFTVRRERAITMLALFRDLDSIKGLSGAGTDGLRRLVSDTQDAQWPISPHHFLLCYLLRRSEYLQDFLNDASVAGQQKRLAIYQLLQFAFAFKPRPGSDPKRLFLEHVRRLEILDEEKQLRQMPAAVNDIDAVKLMTVHASKGLEFPIVHILALTRTLFPAPNRGVPCPLPDGLISTDALMTREAEEDSLFFVGLSRAQDVLHLSHAKTNGKRNENASRLLEAVASRLPTPLAAKASWSVEGNAPPPFSALVGREINDSWTMREIEAYLSCPRKFYYEFVMELSSNESDTPYLKFQSAMHSSMSWLRKTASADERRDGLAAQFEQDWGKFGPGDHPFEPIYRRMAESMINNAVKVMNGESLEAERRVVLTSSGAVITCRADHVQKTDDGIVIQRLKTSRLSQKETPKARYVLLQAAMRVDHPNESISFEHVSLLTGERRKATHTPAKMGEQLAEFEAAIRNAGQGVFDPVPNDWFCPTCPYFFICPSQGAVVAAAT